MLFLFHFSYQNVSSSKYYFTNLRTSEILLFYNLQLFYWHFLEILWLFIFLVFYNLWFSELNFGNLLLAHLIHTFLQELLLDYSYLGKSKSLESHKKWNYNHQILVLSLSFSLPISQIFHRSYLVNLCWFCWFCCKSCPKGIYSTQLMAAHSLFFHNHYLPAVYRKVSYVTAGHIFYKLS